MSREHRLVDYLDDMIEAARQACAYVDGPDEASPPTPQSFTKLYGPPRSSALRYAGRAWMRCRNAVSFG